MVPLRRSFRPHVHFEIYTSMQQATSSNNAIHTSQLALRADICKTAYATTSHSASVANLPQVSLSIDSVFRGGSSLQMAVGVDV
jgi:hypothetical protein